MKAFKKQTNLQFFFKLVKWGTKEIRIYFQPIQYSESKGPRYYRPLGFDDRPLTLKLREKYIYIRIIDQLYCGLVTCWYDHKELFHELAPNLFSRPSKPLHDYYPKWKKFPDEFVESEIARRKRLQLPPHSYFEEFNVTSIQELKEQEETSIFNIGKSLGNRILKSSKVTQLQQQVEDQKTKLSQLKREDIYNAEEQARGKVLEFIGKEKTEQISSAFQQGKDVTNMIVKGDTASAINEMKQAYEKNIRDNQKLKDVLKEESSKFQVYLRSFIEGYEEGKSYEQDHPTDPKQLLQYVQNSAKKAVFIGAQQVSADNKDWKSKAESFVSNIQNIDNITITEEEERKLKESAKEWVKKQQEEIIEKATSVSNEFAQTSEGIALKKKLDKTTKQINEVSHNVQTATEQIIEKGKSEIPTIHEKLESAFEKATKKKQENEEGDKSNKKS